MWVYHFKTLLTNLRFKHSNHSHSFYFAGIVYIPWAICNKIVLKAFNYILYQGLLISIYLYHLPGSGVDKYDVFLFVHIMRWRENAALLSERGLSLSRYDITRAMSVSLKQRDLYPRAKY